MQITPTTWSPTAIEDDTTFSALAQSWARRTIADRPITWTTEPAGIVFVTENGSAVVLDAGTTQVRATIDGVTASATVNVVQTIQSVVILSYFGNTISALGDSLFLYVDARDRNDYSVAGTRFTLESLNPGVAMVTPQGWVKAVSAGSADIVALAAGKADTAPVHVVIP